MVLGHIIGLYLFGRGGAGKSANVIRELEALEAHYVLVNTHLTGRGMFDLLRRSPDAVVLVEDAEQVLRDKAAVGLLRSCLWGQSARGGGPRQRWVTWSAHGREARFLFTGGVIITANCPIDDVPALAALRSRLVYLELPVTDAEVRAWMRRRAGDGYESGGRRLDPASCREVVEYLIQQSAGGPPLDVRAMFHAFDSRLQWEDGNAGCHWEYLVSSQLQGRPTEFQQGVNLGPAALWNRWELMLVAEIIAATSDRKERLRRWQAQTGKAEATLYRRIAELEG